VRAAAIETRGLTKHYGPVRALEDLTLRVEEGEVFGFLGPNGAGKTTTIRLMLGLLRPTAGEAVVLGAAADRGSRRRAEVGYLPGELQLWPWYTGRQTLAMLEALTGRPATDRDALLERLALAPADLARAVGTYSDGMKQKLGIVQALQCRPRLALLDEPTKGLDPLMQQAFYEAVDQARERGTTVFFSSHVLPEVERVSGRVAMLKEGRLLSVAGVEDVRRAQQRRVEVRFSADVEDAGLAHFGEIVERGPRRVVMRVGQVELPALVARLGMLPIADLVVESPRLEDAFLEFYR
jgi:ABC-2 type transport system ATP-binding protein